MKNTVVYLSLLIIGLSSCSKDEVREDIPEGTNFRVNYFTASCEGVAVQNCLLVQEGNDIGTKEWDYFYSSIEDFEFESGYIYNLDVTKTKIENPPADGSSYNYKLIRIISKTAVECQFQNPTTDLDWIRFEIQRRISNPSLDIKYCYISQAELNGNVVFIYGDCNPLINKVIPVFDCLGNSLGHIGESSIPYTDIKNEKVVWKPQSFVCQLDF